jgi:hypothetical protein
MQYPNKDYSFKDFRLAILDVRKYLARRILFISVTSFVTLLIGFCYSFFEPNKYVAKIKFTNDVPQEEKLNVLNNFSQKVGVITANSNPFYEGLNIIGLLKSRTIITETLNTTFTGNDFSKKTFLEEYLKKHFTGLSLNTVNVTDNSNSQKIKDSLINLICNRIINNQLTVEKESVSLDFIDYSFIDSDEAFAKNFSEALFDNANKYYQQYKLAGLYKQEMILIASVDSLKKIIDANIDAVAMNTDQTVNAVKSTALVNSKKSEALNIANKDYYEELIKELEAVRISIKNDKPLFKIVEYPTYPLYNKKLTLMFVLPVFFLGGLILATVIVLVKRITDNPNAILYLP